MGLEHSVTLWTERLLLRDAELPDVEAMQRLFASDPKLLELRPDIAASGGYELESVRQYWEGAQLDPQRHVLVADERATQETIGVLDFVTASPADGLPWIGLVLVHGDHQRRGLGAEAFEAVATHLADTGHSVVRMAVMEGNDAGLGFARRLEFEQVADAPTALTGQRAFVLELELSSRHGNDEQHDP